MLTLTKIPMNILSQWWSIQPIEYYERLVEIFRNVVTHIINYNFPKGGTSLPIITYERNLEMALQMTALLFRINLSQRERSQRVPYEIFYIPELLESVDLQQDYLRWIQNQVSLIA